MSAHVGGASVPKLLGFDFWKIKAQSLSRIQNVAKIQNCFIYFVLFTYFPDFIHMLTRLLKFLKHKNINLESCL